MGCNCGGNGTQAKDFEATLTSGATKKFTTEADLRVAIAKGEVTTWRTVDRT